MFKSSLLLLLFAAFGEIFAADVTASDTFYNNATSTCNVGDVCISYLDVAINMISKAKNTCVDGFRHRAQKPVDCSDILQAAQSSRQSRTRRSGIYEIWPMNRIIDGKSLSVFCDMSTEGGGWTVIQRRGDFKRPIDYFFKDWKNYKEGFGDVGRDFWLGNDNIFALTNQKLYSVRFDLQDIEKNKAYALYDKFWIDDEDRSYTIHISDYSGDANDSMTGHNNLKFSTKDRDNDNHKEGSCAEMYKGAWWYGACHSVNLNGLYHKGKHESYADGVNWHGWKGHHESLEWTEIKIRPKSFRPSLETEVTPQ